MTGTVNPAARIGIIGAMDVEIELLHSEMKSQGSFEATRIAGHEVATGSLSGVPVAVAQCDAGMVNAAAFTQLLIDRENVTGIVNTGVAGSLDASIDIGDIVIAEDAVNHIMDVGNLGYAPGQTPGLDTLAFAADPALAGAAARSAKALGMCAHTGRIASGDRFVRDDADKARIRDTFSASCCEMEGASIAQVCWLNSIPFAIVRAISDKADGTDSIDYPTFEAQAARKCAKLVMHMMAQLA